MADIQAAAIRADPKRPGWLVDAMLPLPVGTERVRRHKFSDGYTIGAFPSHRIWFDITLKWSERPEAAEECSRSWQVAEVYHVPPIDQPPKDKAKCCHTGRVSCRFSIDGSKDVYTCDECGAYLKREAWLNQPPKSEHQPPISPTTEQEPAKVFKILPPVEIEAHAQALGWTPESEVLADGSGGIRVYPSKGYLVKGQLISGGTALERHQCDGYTILPNRTVPADPLDQLAAEAQAEGEYQAPKPLRPAGEVAEVPTSLEALYQMGVNRVTMYNCAGDRESAAAWNKALTDLERDFPGLIAAAIERDRRLR